MQILLFVYLVTLSQLQRLFITFLRRLQLGKKLKMSGNGLAAFTYGLNASDLSVCGLQSEHVTRSLVSSSGSYQQTKTCVNSVCVLFQ